MKKPKDIITRKYDTDGMPITREEGLAFALDQLKKSYVFQYGNAVIVVSPQGILHIYRDGGRVSVVEAGTRFMQEVWGKVPFTKLIAPIRQPRVKKLAEFFGWKKIQSLPMGIDIYEVQK